MNKKQRYSGILMPISSLNGADDVGTIGVEAFRFVDYLCDLGVGVWQILPLGRTDGFNSPYQCYSSYAGNEFYIDLAFLHGRGWLNECPLKQDYFASNGEIDWDGVKCNKSVFLQQAFEGFRYQNQFASDGYLAFWQEHQLWLEDYSLFMALTQKYEGVTWSEWPEEIRDRVPNALAQAYNELEEVVLYHRFVQYVFFLEWELLHQYAMQRGVKIMGDLPLYVAFHSSDVWVHPNQFQLNSEYQMTEVGGVPPDDFNENGQHWGSPLFDWDVMAADQYQWWRSRLSFQLKLYDLLRIDHFRGLESYYSIKSIYLDGKVGVWNDARGDEMLSLLPSVMHEKIIAEDLGLIDEKVRSLRDKYHFDGMGVFQFAFDGNVHNVHLPMHYSDTCCAYIGTHDNATLISWYDELEIEQKKLMLEYIGVERLSFRAVARNMMQSHARGVIFQMQDILALGDEGRMNTPGTIDGNWIWRAKDKTLPIHDWLKKDIIRFARSKEVLS
ncbi:4-alpha-glucanotransferase [Halosquirtibacter laminarini]|uniref:4-alpha-glucanotransferase n=1 Tax=Halosquirtibacter laminarini TaxID=3374600 RepID=A0AC61NPW3_9BACT|nr:4-alpha-glucanotransferase [Prolixibacteraceae bacterium]